MENKTQEISDDTPQSSSILDVPDGLNATKLYAFSSGPNEISKILQQAEDPLEAAKSLMLQIFWRIEYHKNYICECPNPKGLEEFQDWMKTRLLPKENLDKTLNFMSKVKSKLAEKADFINALRQHAENYSNRLAAEDSEEEPKRLKLKDSNTTGEEESDSDSDSDHSSSKLVFTSALYYKDQDDFDRRNNLLPKCGHCGSVEIRHLDAVSHSAGTDSLIQLFTYRLPSLRDKSVLDIGSGLGSILFACCCLSEAKSASGIELNGPFCKIVENVAEIFQFSQRIKVIQGDLRDHLNLLGSHDVVIFNNSFEYFLPIEMQIELWCLIKQNMKAGALLVTNPDLDTVLSKLGPGVPFKKEDWVDDYQNETDKDVLLAMEKVEENFCVYVIKK